jgi:hypothetical protein
MECRTCNRHQTPDCQYPDYARNNNRGFCLVHSDKALIQDGHQTVASKPGGTTPSAGYSNCVSGPGLEAGTLTKSCGTRAARPDSSPSSSKVRASFTVAARTALFGIGSVRKSLNLKRIIIKSSDIRKAIEPVSQIYTRRPVLRQDAAKSIAAHLDIQTIQAACKAIHGSVVELQNYIDREVLPCL